jgi:hypothetical protein
MAAPVLKLLLTKKARLEIYFNFSLRARTQSYKTRVRQSQSHRSSLGYSIVDTSHVLVLGDGWCQSSKKNSKCLRSACFVSSTYTAMYEITERTTKTLVLLASRARLYSLSAALKPALYSLSSYLFMNS